ERGDVLAVPDASAGAQHEGTAGVVVAPGVEWMMIEIVQRFTEKFPRPVCVGCPDPKRFDEQVEKWTLALAEQLAHETGERWGVLQNSVTGAGLVELMPDAGPGGGVRIHPWFVVDHPGGGKTIEYS